MDENHHQRRKNKSSKPEPVGPIIKKIMKELAYRHGFEVDNKNIEVDEDKKAKAS